METGAIEASLRRKGAPGKRSISQTLNDSSAKPPQGAVSICRRAWRAMGSSADAPSPAGSRALSTAPIFCISTAFRRDTSKISGTGTARKLGAPISARGLTGAETKAQTERIERSRASQARGEQTPSQGSGEDGGAPVGRRLRCAVRSSLSHQERRRRTWFKAAERWPPDRPALR